jgi:two-component system response regulator AtoC
MNVTSQKPKVLVVDDDPSALESLAEVLSKEEYDVFATRRGREALDLVQNTDRALDLVVTDLRMSGIDGMKILESVREGRPEIPVIVLTAFADMGSAVEAIRKGAFDYLSKPFKLDHLRLVVRRALEQSSLRQENLKLRSALEKRGESNGLIGRSPEMVEVYKLIAKVAPLSTTILVQGESGTGKELVAQLIHELSGRPGAFKAINCGALPESLLESELFGYVKGAFTGATTRKKGIFEAAQAGTCLLDEISNTSPNVQMRLLRVLEEREVQPVGSTDSMKIDVRIISATNRPLDELVEAKEFREDLYYRLKVVTINLPPLRERRGDIPILLNHFVQHFAAVSSKPIAISDPVYSLLASYPWPGNVRELENAVERAIALNSSGILMPTDFPEEIREVGERRPSAGQGPFMTLEEKTLEYVLEILEATGRNVSQTADILGIDRRTVYRILERHDMQPKADHAV